MKKVLALVLAVVLAFGMTTVAFAAGAKKAAEIKIVDALFTIDSDKLVPETEIIPNTTYYYQLTSETVLDSGYENKLSTYGDLRIRTTIDAGGSYIASKPAFVVKGIKDANGKKVNQVFVSFKTADKFNKDAVDVEMSFRAYKGGDEASNEIKLNKSIEYSTIDATSVFTVKKAGGTVKFDDVDDIEMYFAAADDVCFAVNAKGQKDLFIRLDTEDDALEDKYPAADLSIYYFAGNNNTFRRTGTLTIPADMIEGKDGKLVAPFIYANEGGKLVAIKDAKYDEDAAAFTIKTNKLGKYVVSDIELKAAAEDKDGDAETNPDTGANDFVGLAVALAVVSVAGIAVAKRK